MQTKCLTSQNRKYDASQGKNQVEKSGEIEIVTPNIHCGRPEDPLGIYLLECGKTPLLSSEEEKTIGMRLEEGQYLSLLTDELSSEYGHQPGAIDLLVELIKRLCKTKTLFELLCQSLSLPHEKSMVEKLLHPELRCAIDGRINLTLVTALAEACGESHDEVKRDLCELSISSRLAPWSIIADKIQFSSLAVIEEEFHSPSFLAGLETHISEVSDRFEHVMFASDRAAKHLIKANLRLVVSVARKYVSYGIPLSDLIQEGNIGLMSAVQRFDYRLGYRFSTYATYWIWQAIGRAVACQSRTIRIPVHMMEKAIKLGRVSNRLTQEHGRPPTREEIAPELDVTPEKVDEIKQAIAITPTSLNKTIGDEDRDELGQFIKDNVSRSPEEEADDAFLKQKIKIALASLLPRERQVIELRFGLYDGPGQTLEEVGARLGVTRERVRQIEKKALAKLRHPKRSRVLKDYLE